MSNGVAVRCVLAFDYGSRRIGVAVGQSATLTATPLATLSCRADKPDWRAIEALVEEWQPDAIVVGLPATADGGETRLTRLVRRFASELKSRCGRQVALVDERLSTVEARARQRSESGHRRSGGPGTDAVAASVILESWLQSVGARP